MSIETLGEAMENAQGEVATAGMQVADVSEHMTYSGRKGYFVPFDDMKVLKDHVKAWKAACAEFHLAVRKGGG